MNEWAEESDIFKEISDLLLESLVRLETKTQELKITMKKIAKESGMSDKEIRKLLGEEDYSWMQESYKESDK